jgi:transcriptional regulator with XRE-family HTH domain
MTDDTLAQQSSEWIRDAMKAHRLSPDSLAAIAGMSSERVSRLAAGDDYPSHVEVALLAKAVIERSGASPTRSNGIRHRLAEAAGHVMVDGNVAIPSGHPQAARQQGGHSTAGN